MGGPVELVMYVKSGCCLCDDMANIVQRAAMRIGLTLKAVNIDGNAALETEYGTRIPILFYRGEALAKYRTTEGDLLQKIEAIWSKERAGRRDDV